ncbi:TIR domain-containing protein [Solwaraspora sp. WMMD1047]|uniref:KGGVGR-motif variant AAA ATPase n=1 Tax=Solwaraspora sp. WMMD1047 TaxID=3016102 RepID=UPI00241678E0|nr:TIR domain-containing protein [Solwaraspora sp. WMMD1047]MDG4830376.1 TIR domain-containing protein [Solwaraspora sp. WMMD1047]
MTDRGREGVEARRDGKIITFYSYKGGVGRTMALANVAWILASTGRRVLAVDWDLDSPGLHRYFYPFLGDKDQISSSGVIDLLDRCYKAARDDVAFSDEKVIEGLAQVLEYVVTLDWEFPGGGKLDFLPPGRQDSAYSARVSRFDWDSFWERYGGHKFIEALKCSMREHYDFILVDSRTGTSDTAGICAVALPDDVLFCFLMNRQSIDGAAAVAASVRQLAQRPLRLLPVPMRVDEDDIAHLRNNSQSYIRQRFDRMVEDSGVASVNDYWPSIAVPFKKPYGYGELLAAFVELPGQPGTLLAVYERLASVVTGSECRLPVMDPQQRQNGLIAFQGELVRPIDMVVKRRAFLSYVREDLAAVVKIADALRMVGIDVWMDRTHLKVGDRWADTIKDAISEGDYFLAFFSRAYSNRTSTYMNEELLLAVEQLRRRPRARRWFIPITLDQCEIPKYPIGAGETLEQIHHLDFSDDWSSSIAQLITAIVD